MLAPGRHGRDRRRQVEKHGNDTSPGYRPGAAVDGVLPLFQDRFIHWLNLPHRLAVSAMRRRSNAPAGPRQRTSQEGGRRLEFPKRYGVMRRILPSSRRTRAPCHGATALRRAVHVPNNRRHRHNDRNSAARPVRRWCTASGFTSSPMDRKPLHTLERRNLAPSAATPTCVWNVAVTVCVVPPLGSLVSNRELDGMSAQQIDRYVLNRQQCGHDA